jgi:hypothetical protein
MNHPTMAPEPRQELLHHALRFVRHASLCFILFSLVLVFKQGLPGGATDIWMIRSGILRDMTAELPLGRQALVSSLAVMPLPSLAALPFVPFLQPAAFGYAYLYGLALLLALAALPLRNVLNHCFARARIGAVAPGVLALAAFLLGATEWSDLLALLAALILAVHLETRTTPEVRALAGVFWALVLLSHVAGLVLVSVRLVWMGIGRNSFVASFVDQVHDKVYDKVNDKVSQIRRAGDRERRAVNWIQATSIFYGLVVYLFLNGMIMGAPGYPFFTAPWWRLSGRDTAVCKQQLARLLTTRYSDCRPVVSGVWGYAIQPLLESTEGCHVADYDAGKLPPDETGAMVLVIPSGRNPFARFSDRQPDAATAALPICETTDDWTFVRIEPDKTDDR